MVKASYVEKVLKKNGYVKGSHKTHGVFFFHPKTKCTTTVGKHYKDHIPAVTLSKIKKQTGLKF
jgi:predicted RNA binding protein YcfA (HicA-like mRNA interferase family)